MTRLYSTSPRCDLPNETSRVMRRTLTGPCAGFAASARTEQTISAEKVSAAIDVVSLTDRDLMSIG
jgi:hypothetical protein